MSISLTILNWFFILISSILVWKPLKRIFNYISKTIADYAILLIYVFNCVPVLLDCLFEVPEYVSYYSVFGLVLKDFDTCLIYNMYVLLTLLILWYYADRTYLHNRKYNSFKGIEFSLPKYRSLLLDTIIIISPLILTFINYGLDFFASYATLGGRGMASDEVAIVNQLIFVGIFFYATRFFTKERSKYQYLFMVLYFFVLSWLNGKRYIIVTIIEICLFMYQMTGERKRKRVKLWLVFFAAGILMLLFSAYYLTNIRINTASDYLYGTLRIDFGRDDVTKFVINRELIQQNHILNYPGETFLSTAFVWIPRVIWESKPYPHYRYLTAALLNRDILNLPSGMTPSLFEMCIANFYWFGLILCPLMLVVICRFGDKSKKLTTKLLFLLLVTVFLTQSIDIMLFLLIILFVGYILTRVRIGNYRIGIRLGK